MGVCAFTDAEWCSLQHRHQPFNISTPRALECCVRQEPANRCSQSTLSSLNTLSRIFILKGDEYTQFCRQRMAGWFAHFELLCYIWHNAQSIQFRLELKLLFSMDCAKGDANFKLQKVLIVYSSPASAMWIVMRE